MRNGIFVVLFSMAIIGCAHQGNDIAYEPVDSEILNSGTHDVQAAEPRQTNVDNAVNQAVSVRHVIYDAKVDLIVEDFSTFCKQLPDLVTSCDGYVADVVINQRRTSRKGTWQLKIRSTRFDHFFVEMAALGVIENHHQTAKDVSSQFVDLNARIVNKKRMEQRVLALLDESNRNLKDVIGLEKELARLRGEVERMQGHLNALKKKTEYATITIVATEEPKPEPAVELSFGKRVAASWSTSIDLLSTCLQRVTVVVVYVLPWMVLIAVLFLPIYLYFRRRAIVSTVA